MLVQVNYVTKELEGKTQFARAVQIGDKVKATALDVHNNKFEGIMTECANMLKAVDSLKMNPSAKNILSVTLPDFYMAKVLRGYSLAKNGTAINKETAMFKGETDLAPTVAFVQELTAILKKGWSVRFQSYSSLQYFVVDAQGYAGQTEATFENGVSKDGFTLAGGNTASGTYVLKEEKGQVLAVRPDSKTQKESRARFAAAMGTLNKFDANVLLNAF